MPQGGTRSQGPRVNGLELSTRRRSVDRDPLRPPSRTSRSSPVVGGARSGHTDLHTPQEVSPQAESVHVLVPPSEYHRHARCRHRGPPRRPEPGPGRSTIERHRVRDGPDLSEPRGVGLRRPLGVVVTVLLKLVLLAVPPVARGTVARQGGRRPGAPATRTDETPGFRGLQVQLRKHLYRLLLRPPPVAHLLPLLGLELVLEEVEETQPRRAEVLERLHLLPVLRPVLL